MNKHKIAVIKFGSSVLTAVADIPAAIHETYQYLREGYKVLVVISAIGHTTDELVNLNSQIFNDPKIVPQPRAYAELLSAGETIAAALFTIALDHAGVPALKLDHRCLQTVGSVTDAQPQQFDKEKITQLFNQYAVLVMPGFIGCNVADAITLLGRGGSDFSAVFAAWSLKAERCILYKNTDGIFDQDPEAENVVARRYQTLSYTDCLKIPYPVVQHKALQFAQEKNFAFVVKALGSSQGTYIGNVTALAEKQNTNRKLKIILLGLGTVGFGVYRNLLASSDRFEIVGIGIKNPVKHAHHEIPSQIISNNIDEILSRECDVVVELIGEPALSQQLIIDALRKRRHVVTANKCLIAEKGAYLSELAAEQGVKLFYSAAVAGAVPVLETVAALKKINDKQVIKSITGILNGTCNFILDKVSQGETFVAAIKLAQTAGFAEADPSLDINGLDAAQKLTIISRWAFNQKLEKLDVCGIEHLDEKTVQTAAKNDQVVKLVAHCTWDQHGVQASVKPVFLPRMHRLASVSGENNCILIQTLQDEIIELHGKGAGRWPTAEAVYADLLDLSHQALGGQR